MLHRHILHVEAVSAESTWRNHSQAALDTVAQIIVDISRSHRGIPDAKIDIISPICNYLIRDTLQHIYERRYADSKKWFDDADALRESLEKLDRRWSIDANSFLGG
jgi:adenylate kinase